MNTPLPFNSNGGVPIVGAQQQMAVLTAQVMITPALVKKLETWSQKTGIPFNEIGQTIFRIGLIGLSLNMESPGMTSDDAMECIPLTKNEEEGNYN